MTSSRMVTNVGCASLCPHHGVTVSDNQSGVLPLGADLTFGVLGSMLTQPTPPESCPALSRPPQPHTYICFLFQWKTYNPAFSQLEIWFRFVFVVLTFIVTVSTVCLGAPSPPSLGMRLICEVPIGREQAPGSFTQTLSEAL